MVMEIICDFISIFAEKCIKYGKIAYISIAKMEGKP